MDDGATSQIDWIWSSGTYRWLGSSIDDILLLTLYKPR
jgi:hypothetical protein